MPAVSVRQFARLMTQRVTIAPKTGYDDFGKPTYGTAVVYQAAVVGEMKRIPTGNDQETPSYQTVYLMGNPATRPEDQVTLSTGDVGSTESYALTPPILGVGRYPFTRGQFCTVIYLGRGSGG